MKIAHPAPLNCFRALRLVLCALPFFLWSVAIAADVAKVKFDVPAGDAGQTLKQFAAQAKREILFPVQPVGTVKTAGVRGELTVKEGLDRLLTGTELTALEDPKTGAIVVKRDVSPNAPSRPQKDEAPANVEEGKLVLDKFEVFGSKSINADLPRTRDDVQPYVVFGREQLQASPAPNLEEFFRSRLPMNQASPTSSSFLNTDTTSTINLRGLGANQTLILLDGRRLPPKAGAGGITSQADINGIPLSMIERIEILPSTASGIFGGGATGGVINIITRKDYAGVEVTATYQNAFDTDAATRRIDLNGSFQLEGGKTMVTFNYSHTENNAMLLQDRDFAARSRALFQQNNPAGVTSASTPPFGYLANIRNQNGSNLILKNGTPLNSPITHVPAGYAGPASDGGAAFVANAGRYDLNFPNASFGLLNQLRAVPTTEAFGLSLRRSFGTRVEAYLDASRATNEGVGFLGGNGSTTIAANAPNNPFTSAVTVSFPNLAPRLVTESISESDRLAGGVVVRLPADWVAGADYVYSRSMFGSAPPNAQLGDPDGTGPAISYAAALSSGVLNVLRDLYANPLDLTPYLFPQPLNKSFAELKAEEWTLRASGPILKLPAGPLTLSASVQERKEEIAPFVTTGVVTSNPTPTYRWQPLVNSRAWAYYAELSLPVVNAESHIPLVRGLEFQASVRRDDLTLRTRASNAAIILPDPSGPFPDVAYLDRDYQATKATVGVKYTVTEDLTLRASYGNGFLPPTLNQLSPGASPTLNLPLNDPRRGSVTATAPRTLVSGGSPNLTPEESESTSAGVVFTPGFAPGLRLSVDYTRIVKTNEIGFLSFPNIVNLEALFPDRVVRAALTPADQALGYTGGVVTEIDARSLNLAGKRLEAWDLQADYTWKPASWGEFQAYALATYQPHLESQPVPEAAWIETVGFNSGAIEWRGNGGLNWSRGAWTVGWNAQYYHSYLVYSATDGAPAQTAAILNQGADTVPSQTYHDLSVAYRWGAQPAGWQRFLAQSQLTIGVQNVFDKSPPITAAIDPFFGSSAYSNFGDPRLRRYSISLRKKF